RESLAAAACRTPDPTPTVPHPARENAAVAGPRESSAPELPAHALSAKPPRPCRGQVTIATTFQFRRSGPLDAAPARSWCETVGLRTARAGPSPGSSRATDDREWQ